MIIMYIFAGEALRYDPQCEYIKITNWFKIFSVA